MNYFRIVLLNLIEDRLLDLVVVFHSYMVLGVNYWDFDFRLLVRFYSNGILFEYFFRVRHAIL